jgi:hypothetical protein
MAFEILEEAFDEISGLLKGRFTGLDFSVIRQTMTTHPLYVEKVIAHLIEKNMKSLHNMAHGAGIEFDDFMFLMINWLKPVFLALRDKYPPDGGGARRRILSLLRILSRYGNHFPGQRRG